MQQRNAFDLGGTFGNKFADEMSTEDIDQEKEVFDGDELIGETARSSEPKQRGYMARTAHYVRYGNIPGQMTGWVGPYRTRKEAEEKLREHVNSRRNNP